MESAGTLNRTWSRAQAAATIERLLEDQVAYGVLDGHPKTLAHDMVARLWAQEPALLEGASGPVPHQMTVAASALAAGTRREARCNNTDLQGAYTLALGLILDEIAHNAHAYGLHHIDHQLLDSAAATFSEQACALQRAARQESSDH
ncbi:hypothetical protein ACXU4B_05825 [Dyella soli]|uniref:Uncharacterized protein n=1 Tax=Dyella soli TaxID=522319 RepID=A0A4R0YVB9_9GAMM|nr:hypothetical protein [Dyella soli]TCI10512.1 hypothetical protein EZM97_16720 [Dyella soli]